MKTKCPKCKYEQVESVTLEEGECMACGEKITPVENRSEKTYPTGEPQTETRNGGTCIHCGKPMIVPKNEMAGIAHKRCVQNKPQLSEEMEQIKSEVRSICKGAYWYGEDSGDYDCTNYDGVDEIMTLLATALEEQRIKYLEQMKLLMDADLAEGFGDNLEKMFGQRECKICGTNPEKQRELVLAILNGKGE